MLKYLQDRACWMSRPKWRAGAEVQIETLTFVFWVAVGDFKVSLLLLPEMCSAGVLVPGFAFYAGIAGNSGEYLLHLGEGNSRE